jgi:hypothetical protein
MDVAQVLRKRRHVDEHVQQAREVQRRKEADDQRRRDGGGEDGMGKTKPLTSFFFSVPKRTLKLADVERPCRTWTTTSTTIFPAPSSTKTLRPTD